MKSLSRDEILQADDLPIEVVDVPEWKGTVHLRALSGTERDEFEQLCQDRKSAKHFDIRGVKIRLVVLSLCDEAGKCLFGESDISKLQAKSAAAIDILFDIAQRLSGLKDEDVKELSENLEEGPSEDSGSS